jgi:hypothetical protein
MSAAGVDAFLVPSEDPHMSEYAPDCDNRRAFISEFDGSAGTAVVTTSEAALWTDGRYFLQVGLSGSSLLRCRLPGHFLCPLAVDLVMCFLLLFQYVALLLMLVAVLKRIRRVSHDNHVW